jgi:L-iditol 2-dehydrogenase
MRSYYLQEPGKIESYEEPVPAISDHEVLIKVHTIGLCGSDLHLFNGTYNGPCGYPVRFGHEWSGVVEVTGGAVRKVRPGDVVTGDCSFFCGACAACSVDKNVCDTIEKCGITIDGTSAEYVVRDEKYVYPAPKGLTHDLVALTEPVAVAANMLDKIKRIQSDFADKKILIYGGGTIGLSALLLLRYHYNAQDISLIDLIDNRCRIARELGAVIPSPEALEYAPKDGSYSAIYSAAKYDVIIETTGVNAVFAHCFNLARTLGIIGCLGMLGEASFAQKMMVIKSLRVLGSIGGTGQFETVLDFLNTHQQQARKLISHSFTKEQMKEAFVVAKDADRAVKVEVTL